MPTRFDPATGGLIFVPQEKENEIIVKTASQLSGVLDSGKTYFIDGLIDVTSIVPILVPSGGMYTGGHGYGISGLFSTGSSDVMFQTPNAKHTLSSDRTGGTFTLTYDGQTTSPLNWNATAAQVDAALEALSNIGSGDVTCTGGDLPTDIVIEFTGMLAKTDVPLITVTDSGTGGTGVTIAETVIGYSGDFIVQNAFFYQTGAGSMLFDIDNDENNGAFELNSVNLGTFSVTTPSFGEVSNYRQFRTGDFAAINYTDGFTFNGTMSGGFAVNDSIILSPVSGSTFLKEGTSLSIGNGLSSNMNALSLSGTMEFCDFQASNFDSGAVMNLSGFRTGADDPIPNIDSKDIKAKFTGCVGVDNTFVGASWALSTESATTVSVTNTLYKVAGTTTASLDGHFTHPTNNRLQYNGEATIKVDIMGFFELSSAGTESFQVEVRQWDSSASSWIDLRTVPCETALKILGDRRGNGSIVANALLETGDYIEVWVKAASGTPNPTMELESTITVSERS